MSLPSRASDHLERTGGQLPEMSSAGTDGTRTCGGTEQDSAPDAEAVRGEGRLPGREQLLFERSGGKGAEVEADGRQRSGAGSAIGGICAATKPRDAEVGATTSNKTKLAVINTDFAFFQITVLITYFFFSLSVRYNPNMCYLPGAVRSGRNTTLQVFRVKKMKYFKFFLTDFLLFC